MSVFKLLLFVVFSLSMVGCQKKEITYSFTEEEKRFIETTTIRWASEIDSVPLIFVDSTGSPAGISKDYLDLISKKTGLKFVSSHDGNKEEVMLALRNNRVDMVTTMRMTSERFEHVDFTRPYVFSDSVLVKKTNFPKTTGIGRAYAVKRYLVERRQDLTLVEFNSDEDAFRALINGDIESVVMDKFSADYFRKKYNTNFDSVTIKFDYFYSFAVSKELAILKNILDKAIQNITKEEHEEILKKWM